MIHLDTSALIASAEPHSETLGRLKTLIAMGEVMTISAVVLFEWLRGPRSPQHLSFQAALFPSAGVVSFGFEEAATAAALYKAVRRPRSREIDIAIAACAITHDATLWTLNPQDFKDIPGLTLL